MSGTHSGPLPCLSARGLPIHGEACAASTSPYLAWRGGPHYGLCSRTPLGPTSSATREASHQVLFALAAQPPGMLPRERTEGSTAFEVVGLDFAGPIK